ncbi:E3 ubiquitin- ligase SINA-like 6 [Olea europaea subsp. europaea]|uniref:RING-type E3 ubiquitin transferase n=1 Tax=Olea europaea subsp. europaea TaxID=158383 RepID=A0A8S0RXQ1_OLEEU|nr:E3 ubiquitin- ligase SINA-like 6 [Olea europaea subsp. europaea]
MVRFSVGGSEGEEDRDSTNRKRPVSENSRTSTNDGYQDKDEHGSYSIKFSTNKPRPSITSTKNPRLSTPTVAVCATTSATPQQRGKLRIFDDDGIFGGIIDQEEEDHMEETKEEAHEPSDKEEKTDGQLSVILSDPDVLDCPICLEPLTLPVFQCENGHIACAPCCTKMLNRCRNCSLPIGYNRCRAIEKVVESVKISCQNADYGCKQTIHYGYKLDHEKACLYMPCSCPQIACNYVGSSKGLYRHFELNHSNCSRQFRFNLMVSISLEKNQNQLFLQEKTEGTLFILNRSIDRLGSLFNVVCVGPSSAKRRYSYTLTSKDGESSIKLESVADNMPKWIPQPPVKKYLLVPNDFIGSSGELKLEVIIWSPHHESP